MEAYTDMHVFVDSGPNWEIHIQLTKCCKQSQIVLIVWRVA